MQAAWLDIKGKKREEKIIARGCKVSLYPLLISIHSMAAEKFLLYYEQILTEIGAESRLFEPAAASAEDLSLVDRRKEAKKIGTN